MSSLARFATSWQYAQPWLGATHVVMGTDYPFEMGDASPVATVQAIPGLSDEQQGLILEGNVLRLLDDIQR